MTSIADMEWHLEINLFSNWLLEAAIRGVIYPKDLVLILCRGRTIYHLSMRILFSKSSKIRNSTWTKICEWIETIFKWNRQQLIKYLYSNRNLGGAVILSPPPACVFAGIWNECVSKQEIMMRSWWMLLSCLSIKVGRVGWVDGVDIALNVSPVAPPQI